MMSDDKKDNNEENEKRMWEAIGKVRAEFEEKRMNKIPINPGDCSYCVNMSGGISAGGKGRGRLAAGIESTLSGEFGVRDPETKEIVTDIIDFNNIQEFKVSISAGDVAQATFTTFEGDMVHCAVSELKVSLDGMRGADFNIAKYFNRDKPCDEIEEGIK